MLQRLEAIKAKLEVLERAGINEAREIIADIEEAIGWHKAATADSNTETLQPAEGVQVITGSADASAEIPAGYAPIANADPASADPAPAA